MRGLEKFILIAVFVVPIVICSIILKSIWSDDTNVNESKKNDVIVSIGEDTVYQSGDEIISGEDISSGSDNGNSSGSQSGEGTKPEQISKLYTDAVIDAVLADVYSATDVTSERIGTMEKYTKVTAQKFSGGWSQVAGIDSKGMSISGWMKTDNISFPSDVNGDLNVTPSNGTGVVTAEPYLNVRLNPSTDAEIIATVDKGKTVTIEESTNGWHKITVNGRTGWVSSAYIK
ncbi:MAG: SH3 domain-containing protein [Clostridia bacterium]|nr:SH3 domain-containing protein [Clostridia bacterium]